MTKPHPEKLPVDQQAGILCNDTRFQKFAAVQSGLPDTQFNESATSEFLRNACHITSRRELKTNQDARDRFDTLRAEFDVWTGRAPAPR